MSYEYDDLKQDVINKVIYPIPVVKYNAITSAEMANMILSPFGQPCNKPQKENTMAYGNSTQATAAITVAAAPVDEAKRYLRDRLDASFWNKRSKIDEKFRPPRPKNAKEALKWLKEGNYFLDKRCLKQIEADYEDEDEEKYYDYWDFLNALNWGKTPVDLKARSKAYEDLEGARTKASDVIEVSTDEKARLEALHEFEAYTIH